MPGFGKKKSQEPGDGSQSGDARREAFSLLVAYAKQETLEPFKSLMRFVLFGTLGSVAITIGTVLFLVAVLRILQGETGAFHGNLSWLPYVIVAALGCAAIAAASLRIAAGPAARRVPRKKSSD